MKKPPPQMGAQHDARDFVRELLEAGRGVGGETGYELGHELGYDVEAGLARHVAAVQAGAPLPEWAQELVNSSAVAGAGGAGAAVGAAGAAAGNKLAALKLAAWLLVPAAAAGTWAALSLGGAGDASETATSGRRGERGESQSAQSGPIAAPARVPSAERAGDVNSAALPAGPAGSDLSQAQADTTESMESIESMELEASRSNPQRGRKQAQRDSSKAIGPADGKPAALGEASGRVHNAKTIEALIEKASVGSARAAQSTGQTELLGPSNPARSASTAQDSAGQNQAASAQQAAAAPAPSPAVLDDSRLEREMGMLAVAQRVLKSDPERALRLARQGEHEFPSSMFTQERQQVLLLALIELGRVSEAKRLAAPYLKRYPNGPFSDRVRAALASGRVEN